MEWCFLLCQNASKVAEKGTTSRSTVRLTMTPYVLVSNSSLFGFPYFFPAQHKSVRPRSSRVRVDSIPHSKIDLPERHFPISVHIYECKVLSIPLESLSPASTFRHSYSGAKTACSLQQIGEVSLLCALRLSFTLATLEFSCDRWLASWQKIFHFPSSRSDRLSVSLMDQAF